MRLNHLLALVTLLAFAGPALAAAPTTTGFQNQLHVMKATYSFATQGGGTGTINLKGRDGTDAVLPSGAIIVKATINVTTAIVSTSNDGTIALQAESAGDLLATVDADTVSTINTGVPTGSSATGAVKPRIEH